MEEPPSDLLYLPESQEAETPMGDNGSSTPYPAFFALLFRPHTVIPEPESTATSGSICVPF